MFSAVLLAMVPWMQISKAVADHVAVQPAALLAAVSAGVAIHLVFLAFNMAAVSALQLGGSEKPSGEAPQDMALLLARDFVDLDQVTDSTEIAVSCL